jgi:anti-sigma-K factor RskA
MHGMNITTVVLFITMILSADAIHSAKECSLRATIDSHVAHKHERHRRRVSARISTCGKHEDKIHRAKNAVSKFCSANNATAQTRVRSDGGMQTEWVSFDDVRGLKDVEWLQTIPLKNVTVEHRVVFSDGTSSETEMRLDAALSANDLSNDKFSRTLLWDWDAFWISVAVVAAVALLAVLLITYLPVVLTTETVVVATETVQETEAFVQTLREMEMTGMISEIRTTATTSFSIH